MDRIHHEGRLHGHHRPVTGIDALNLAGHKAVGHIRRAKPAVFFGDSQTQQTNFTHLGENRRVNIGLAVSGGHDRGQLVLGKGSSGVAQHAFILR